jgi:hypothetical protein
LLLLLSLLLLLPQLLQLLLLLLLLLLPQLVQLLLLVPHRRATPDWSWAIQPAIVTITHKVVPSNHPALALWLIHSSAAAIQFILEVYTSVNNTHECARAIQAAAAACACCAKSPCQACCCCVALSG